jgi:threonine aldolase
LAATETLPVTPLTTPAATALIDLRSDTVTKPTPAMRSAMAQAEVGDDVYGEDPTVNLLEQRAAQTFGRQAALFFPTGSMANQTAIRLHTTRGQEVVCEARGHIFDWEMGMVSDYAGCQIRTALAPDGVFTWAHIRPLLSETGLYYRPTTGLISLENTHNMAGGVCTPLPVYEEIWHEARRRGIPVHLDGARVFHAVAHLGTPVEELTRGFDSVMFCLSKGLCAPVGSMLVGSQEFITRARAVRKALGGGMRQAGILAAAGLIALEQMPARLHEDHSNARLLAETLASLPQVALDLSLVQTNIVIFRVHDPRTALPVDAAPILARLRSLGVVAGAVGPNAIRFVTHHDVDRSACSTAARLTAQVLDELYPA